ncbi:GntR family transcriptional regulator [Actinocorallia longicatena]|uniref:GntR family transcriptional regulator n=1 Tax=Actinocorallia longicatena TaxID=111803 RepID=A0ABP6QNY7_9ACTN
MGQRYQEIADDLRRRIAEGEWRPGDVLPRMVDLAAEYEAARNTVAAAIDRLEGERLVFSAPKRGTVVLRPGERRTLQRGNLVKRSNRHVGPGGERRTGGYNFPAALSGDELWVHHVPPTSEYAPIPERPAGKLKVLAGAMVLRRRRVTGPEGEAPFQLSDSWIEPVAAAEVPAVAEQGAGPGAWLDRLEEAGHGPIQWLEVQRVRMPVKEEADLLAIPLSIPVIEIVRIGYSARTERPVEVTVVRIPGDRVEIISRLERDASAAWPTR